MKTVTYIDPPSGHLYGFPKILPEGTEDPQSWMIANGYPQKEIDSLGKYFYWRTWQEEMTDEDYNLL